MSKKTCLTIAVASICALSINTSFAHDHLSNGATSAGADVRGFGNPVAGNPSDGTSRVSDPGTVPGLGNPKGGRNQGTPSFDSEALDTRLGN